MLTIKDVKELQGESLVTVRKGKKIVTYEYSVKLDFMCAMVDEANSKVIGQLEGQYIIPEISNDVLDDGDEWEINASIHSGDEAMKEKFSQIIKKVAPAELRKQIIKQFVEELKKKWEKLTRLIYEFLVRICQYSIS